MAQVSDGSENRGGEDFLRRVADRVPGAMKACIDRYERLVWGITRRYVHMPSDAEDVVQEVFTELWKKAHRYDAKQASETTFIAVITRRRSIDWVRRKTRMPELTPIGEAADMPEPVPAGTRFDPEQVRAALASLPEPTRRVFALHFDKGLTHPEVADETGLPLGTVKTRLRRGLIEIRQRMSSEESTHNYKVS